MRTATAHNESNAKRDAKGRFLPGHKPPRSPGRPVGAQGVQARAAHLASNRLEAMLGKAADVIDAALDNGDTHVATWLIDRVRPPKQADFLKTDILTDLKTPEVVVEAGRQVMLAAGRGEISPSEARAYVDLLARYGGMQGYAELEQLKQRVDALNVPQRGGSRTMDLSRVPEEFRPVWGCGIDNTSKGKAPR